MTLRPSEFDNVQSLFESNHLGSEIPSGLRRQLETLLRCDLSTVRIACEPRLELFGALGCARGESVLLAPSAPGFLTAAGVAVLGHEIAHVLQRRAGRVGQSPIVEDPLLEAEADRVGLHCAARLFPNSIRDPGLPETAVHAGSSPVRQSSQPVQFLISSRDSFNALVGAAWTYFLTPGTNQLSPAAILQNVYNYGAQYNPLNVPVKNPLAGPGLYADMRRYILATQQGHERRIRLQAVGAWPVITDEVPGLAAYYQQKANGNQPVAPAHATELTRTYLHVYPAHPAQANWRIGVNVEPRSMAVAMERFVPLLDQFANIDHMKFLGPGNAAKADSLIVYLDHTMPKYDLLMQAVLDAAAPLHLQHLSGAMWEEIANGIAIASEPPLRGTSFTQYRCLVIYLAYWQYAMWVNLGQLPAGCQDFRQFLAATMRIFGLSAEDPYTQGPLLTGWEHFQVWWDALVMLKNAWA